MVGTFREPSCGRSRQPIHSIPYSVAQPLERGSNNYYSIIQGATFNKSIHIIKDISYTTRHIDEANVIRAKSEASKDSRDFKQLIILLGIMLLIPVAMLLGLTLNKFIAESEGKINAGYYRDLIGEDYESVAAHFEAAGFTNIELIDLEDSGIAFWTNGKVEMISIGGNTDFETTDWFSPDTKVVISYH